MAAVGRKERCLAAVCEMVVRRWRVRVSLMLLVHANGGAICGCRRVLGGVRARGKLMLLLLEQVVVPIILLPLGVHDGYRWRTKMMAGSGQFEHES